MKNIILLVGIATLCACSEDAVVEEPAADPAPAERSMIGVYEEETANGEIMVTHMQEDGTYKELVKEVLQESGTWTDDGKVVCFDPEGDDNAERCFTISEIAEDGTFEATLVEGGESITVKKVS